MGNKYTSIFKITGVNYVSTELADCVMWCHECDEL